MLRLLTPILIFLLGLSISIYSYITYSDFNSYGAAFFPTIIGILLSLFSIIDFFMELKLKNKYVFQSINLKRNTIGICIVSFSILSYIVFSHFIGFVLTVSLILNFLIIPLLDKNKTIVSIFLIALSLGIYSVFSKILLVSLPSGILFN